MEEHPQRAGDGSDAMAEKPGTPDPEESTQLESESFASSIVSHLQAVAEPVANAFGTVIEAAGQAMSGPADLAGRIHRAISPEPLANLYEVHPEARMASPRELGMRFIPSRRSSARPSPAPPNAAAISCRCDSSAATTGRPAGNGF